MNKKAFTLEEVLITLSILGVIAAITVPSVYRSYKKAYTITRLKLAYSMLVQATQIAEAELGKSSDKWDYTPGWGGVIEDILPSRLNVAQICSDDVPCLGIKGTEIGKGPQTYLSKGDGTYLNLYWTGEHGVILKNGMSIAFYQCILASSGFGLKNYYCPVLVDIDGPNKGKNQLNNDTFVVFYSPGESDTQTQNPRFTPYTVEHHYKRYGMSSDCTAANRCLNVKTNCTATLNSSCWGYIMLNGWKIPDDYPVKF